MRRWRNEMIRLYINILVLTLSARKMSFTNALSISSHRKMLNRQQISLHATQTQPISSGQRANIYVTHWENLLRDEQQEAVAELRLRRSTWSRYRLEESGLSIFDASAEPESDLFGEKIVRIYKEGEMRFRDRYSRGDVLVLTTLGRVAAKYDAVPRECAVVDVGKNWLTVAVGPTWPQGLWESRRLPGSFMVRLDRNAPQAPLKAQRVALERTRRGIAGEAVALLAKSFVSTHDDASNSAEREARKRPARFRDMEEAALQEIIEASLSESIDTSSFEPNESQKDAIKKALCRQVSLVVGPPGTGKTRVAALLVATAMRIRSSSDSQSTRVLAVAHSNGAADVLLEALLQLGVPAIRAGRPASVSPSVQHRTVIAMAERHPEVIRLRQQAGNMTIESHIRSSTIIEVKTCVAEVCQAILNTAPVVVASCIGAHQLMRDDEKVAFPVVVIDEAAQTTEPALLCALAAAKAEQTVFVGDPRQLPPTVASKSTTLREQLGISPMARLEALGIAQTTLRIQYRMPFPLLEFPSKHFYNGMVQCAEGAMTIDPPKGFPWPNAVTPLAFVQLGKNLESGHEFGGRSNLCEAEVVSDIAYSFVQEGDVKGNNIVIISPYAKQVQRIRIELAKRNVRGVRVGTVDSFQGQETEVVLFSSVRSNSKGELGFLRDPRRLCVALTRAKRGLVLVGDETVLNTSLDWRALISYSRQRGCFLSSEDLELANSRPMVL